MKPRVGISCDVTAVDVPRLNVQLTYVDFVAGGGGIPIILPPDATALEALSVCDGVVFIGGDDYRCGNRGADPANFEAVHPRRESSDLALAAEVLKQDLPCLSVCAGFQLMTLVAGGSIFGDLEAEAPASEVRHRREHPDLPLARHAIQWHGSDRVPHVEVGMHEINSHHHQAADALPPEWHALGVAPDGVIEAAVGPGRFQVGVQWHPEREPEAGINHGITRAFLTACKTGARGRKSGT